MKFIHFIYIILICSCAKAPSTNIGVFDELGLCYPPRLEKIESLPVLEDENESEITAKEINGIKYISKTFSSEKCEIEFTINYNEGDVLYEIDDRIFEFRKGSYFNLENRDLSGGLSWMYFANYIVTIGNSKYLISRTYPNYSRSTAFNNIYYIINLSNKTKEVTYSIGSFGYCDNIFSDYNNDGKLDVILIDFIGTSEDRMDLESPKGTFEAQIFTLSKGNILPLENKKGHMKCKYSYEGEETEMIDGNWF